MELKEIGQAKTSEEIEEILNKSELPQIPITYYGSEGFLVPIEEINNKNLYLGICGMMCNDVQ